MKRLFALGMAALFSVFAGIGFTLPKEDNFFFNPASGMEAYYQASNTDGDVQYRQLYRTVKGYSSDAQEQCDTTRRQEPRKEWVEVSTRLKSFPAGVWDPVYVDENVSVDVRKTSVVYTLNEPVNICAPIAGKIDTSHYACDYGRFMVFKSELTDGSVIITTIEKARCWYCCAHKKSPIDGRYTATTAESLKGQAMRTGDILCAGQVGATVTLQYTKPD